jgi:hypothetical protein
MCKIFNLYDVFSDLHGKDSKTLIKIIMMALLSFHLHVYCNIKDYRVHLKETHQMLIKLRCIKFILRQIKLIIGFYCTLISLAKCQMKAAYSVLTLNIVSLFNITCI